MLHQLKSYFQFLLKAKSEHGNHSPFVFEWIQKVLYDTTKYPAYISLEKCRKRHLQNNETINVTDFGAGSRVFKSNQRKIKSIVKHAGISPYFSKLLYRIINHYKPNTILEIGTSIGLGTNALCLGNKNAIVTTLEGCSATQLVAKKYLEQYHPANHIEFVNTYPNLS